MRRLSLICLFAFCRSLFADYAWIPEYKKLVAGASLEFFSSSENFGADGSRADLIYNNALSSLSETRFLLNAEYGVAESWTLGLDLGFLSASLSDQTSGASVLSASGLSDITAHAKWGLRFFSPYLVFETRMKVPTAAANLGSTTDISLGDGNFDVGLILHTGFKSKPFIFAVSPGLLIRFGGYSFAATLETMAQFEFTRGYVRAFGELIYSFENNRLFDSSIDTHDALGSGGSYAKLNGTPLGFDMGLLFGYRFVKTLVSEVSIKHSIFGSKYPNYLEFGLSIKYTFDFFDPPKAERVKEVPFDFDYQKY